MNLRTRGFVFTLTVILLFSILLYNMYASLAANSPTGEIEALRLSHKLSYSWEDVAENVEPVVQVTAATNVNNVTFIDSLPAQVNVSNSLAGYQAFIANYYNTPSANATFNPPLPSLNPPLEIQPFGINYTYPDWAKRQVSILCPGGDGCDAVQAIVLNYAMNDTFPCNPDSSTDCKNSINWSPKPDNCAPGSPHCVAFSLNLFDRLNRTYSCIDNGTQDSCPYYSFYWTDSNSPKVTFSVNESANCKFTLLLGGGNLLTLTLQDNNNNPCGIIYANTTLSLNTTSYWVNVFSNLTMRNGASNQSIARTITN